MRSLCPSNTAHSGGSNGTGSLHCGLPNICQPSPVGGGDYCHPILQMKEPRPREMVTYSRSHRQTEWNKGRLSPWAPGFSPSPQTLACSHFLNQVGAPMASWKPQGLQGPGREHSVQTRPGGDNCRSGQQACRKLSATRSQQLSVRTQWTHPAEQGVSHPLCRLQNKTQHRAHSPRQEALGGGGPQAGASGGSFGQDVQGDAGSPVFHYLILWGLSLPLQVP